MKYHKPMACVVHCKRGCSHEAKAFAHNPDGSYLVKLDGPGQNLQTIVGEDVELTDAEAVS